MTSTINRFLKVPIVEMESANANISQSLIKIPYIDIADTVSWVLENHPYAIIPPYNDSMHFSARAASLIRDRLPGVPIVCAASTSDPRAAKDFLQCFREAGFSAFAMAASLGDVVLEHLFPVLPEGIWMHLAGREPRGNLVGKWTWSDETL